MAQSPEDVAGQGRLSLLRGRNYCKIDCGFKFGTFLCLFMNMSVAFATSILIEGKGSMKSPLLPAPNAKAKLAVLYTPSPLSSKEAASILPTTAKEKEPPKASR
jgi:hypothetical protein